jgi:hypothetical protein
VQSKAATGAQQLTEKLNSTASEAKAFTPREDSIAALEALRHPKSSSANSKARIQVPRGARLKGPLFHVTASAQSRRQPMHYLRRTPLWALDPLWLWRSAVQKEWPGF